MVESDAPPLSPPLSDVFHALADATRRGMVEALSQGPRTVSELAAPFDMSLAAASKHIKVLEQAGLLRREVRWRTHHCHLNAAALAQAYTWLASYQRFWNTRLDVLDTLLRLDDLRTLPPHGKDLP